jgi:hypothetical protein
VTPMPVIRSAAARSARSARESPAPVGRMVGVSPTAKENPF